MAEVVVLTTTGAGGAGVYSVVIIQAVSGLI